MVGNKLDQSGAADWFFLSSYIFYLLPAYMDEVMVRNKLSENFLLDQHV